jgi:hypothetical protein
LHLGDRLRSGDPVEQAKRIKYRDVVAHAVRLHNVVDMTNVLRALQQEGIGVTPAMVSRLSPYLTEHLKRLGNIFWIWPRHQHHCSPNRSLSRLPTPL